ncbi:hypothetical protein PGIGA_G00027460 [Pangasianodon gigas]|uniref:Uncharacterized protein n=1 Tax=Pangasianodon gigas TaxID=30993 RepID=A0ACC5WXN7_PANGG|nr:hypothetical protein [Pangasianodon gigas]
MESRQQSVLQAGAAVQAELEEERRRYQGLLREFTRLEQRYDNLRDMSMLPIAERWPGLRRTNSTQSVSLDSISPISPSFGSFPDFSSSEESRRISVTSPFDRRPGSTEAPLNALMEDLGVSKDTGEKMQGEDLHHAYDAVRVANKFLERQLLAQRAEWEQEKIVLTQQLQEAHARDAPVSKELKELMEQLEVREHECCRLRRELKELKHTVTLRRILSYADVRVDVALSLAPGLAAQLLFLCVRQADCSRDEARARGLCTATVTAIKAALKETGRGEDVLPLQVELKEQVRMLGDVCIQAYQQLLSISESRLQPIIGTALSS